MLPICCTDCLLSYEADGLEKMDLDIVTRLAVHYQICSQSVMGNQAGNLKYGGGVSYSMAILFNARSCQDPPGRSVELHYIRWTVEPHCTCHQQQNIHQMPGPLTRAEMCNIVRYLRDCGCYTEKGSFCPVKCNLAATWKSHMHGSCGKSPMRYWATDAMHQSHESVADASVFRQLLEHSSHDAKTAPGVRAGRSEQKLQSVDRGRSELAHVMEMINSFIY